MRATHERYDGGGYPDGLAGETIPIESRIICACDAYSAMTTDRPYRAALQVSEAVAELRQCAGTQFHPAVVTALIDTIGPASAAAHEHVNDQLPESQATDRSTADKALVRLHVPRPFSVKPFRA